MLLGAEPPLGVCVAWDTPACAGPVPGVASGQSAERGEGGAWRVAGAQMCSGSALAHAMALSAGPPKAWVLGRSP